MENAKNSFYIALRNRLAQVNPAQTIFLRGVSRPAVLVEENELATAKPQNDVYQIRWTKVSVDSEMPAAMVRATCEILYSTMGTTNNGGMDRGQCLTAMDSDLLQMLQPCSTPKMAYTQSGSTAELTNIFWTAPVFEAASDVQGVLSRTVTVDVFSLQEVGE
jgi:hypothetical protein